MLISFKVSNFLSFEKEQIFSLVPGKGRSFSDRLYQDNSTKILKFSALFGPNGSGKSNFVNAIDFSREYIIHGNNRATIPKYYKLDTSYKDKPSVFEYKIRTMNKTYTYGFEIVLSKNEIINEWLIYNNNRSNELIFKHDRKNGKFFPGKVFKNQLLLNKLELFADTLDSDNNILFLKLISKYNNLFNEFPETNILRNVFDWFLSKLKVKFPDSVLTDYAYFMSEKNIDEIIGFFNDFDLSISSYKFIECPQEKIAINLPKELFNKLITSIEKDLYDNSDGDDIENNRVMFGLHDDFYVAKIKDDHVSFETIQFFHENTNIPFSMSEESDGTKKIFKLLEILFQKEDDVVYIVDEIDRCLHPLLTYNFINAFLSKKANTSDCQMIVTTHESLLLDFNLLRKDEVRLVTKNKGVSNISSLGDTQIRADKKLIKEYLLGTKGVPKITNNAYS